MRHLRHATILTICLLLLMGSQKICSVDANANLFKVLLCSPASHILMAGSFEGLCQSQWCLQSRKLVKFCCSAGFLQFCWLSSVLLSFCWRQVPGGIGNHKICGIGNHKIAIEVAGKCCVTWMVIILVILNISNIEMCARVLFNLKKVIPKKFMRARVLKKVIPKRCASDYLVIISPLRSHPSNLLLRPSLSLYQSISIHWSYLTSLSTSLSRS